MNPSKKEINLISKFRMSLMLIVLLAITGLSSCDKPIENTVVIEYEETAVFSEFDAPPAPGGVPIKTFAGEGLFAAFKIISIQNEATGAKDFSFDPNKVYVNSAPQAKMAGGVLSPYSTAVSQLVLKGTTSFLGGRIIINIPGDPNVLKNGDNLLLYESQNGESVIFVRRAIAKQILDPGTPNNLP